MLTIETNMKVLKIVLYRGFLGMKKIGLWVVLEPHLWYEA